MWFHRKITVSQELLDQYRKDLAAGISIAPESQKPLYDLHLKGLAELEELLKNEASVEDIASVLRTERRSHGWSYLSGEVGARTTTSADRLYCHLEKQIFRMKGKVWYYANDQGKPAPEFNLRDGDGKSWQLSDHRGKTVVLLFYPGDNTPVCTRQMCSVRDHWSEYQATGAEVVGISTDSIESHEGFAEKHSLPLRLLSDPDGKVSAQYGMKSWLPGRSARGVVVIDKEGKISYQKVQTVSLFRPADADVIEAIKQAG